MLLFFYKTGVTVAPPTELLSILNDKSYIKGLSLVSGKKEVLGKFKPFSIKCI